MFHFPKAVLGQHIAVLGKTGSGKTLTEKLAVEQVVADGARVCVLDTVKSDWWGITSSASGKRAGLPFKILGGPRGHVPLHANAGKVIGQLVATGKLPLSIVDMADFEAGGVQRFFVDFAQALFRHMRGVVYLVIEEAHEVAPKERAGFGAENLAIHWAKKLATGGRSKGIRLIVATQRVQSLHNAVLGSCETVIAHRLTTPADQEPVLKWMKANVEKDVQVQVAESLSSLPTGTGWLCSGEAKIFERVAFPKFKTYDNSATPTGDEADVDVTTAAVDQDELRAIIGDAVKQAEADDPRLLRTELAKVRRDLQAALSNPAQTAPDKNAEAKAYARGKIDGYGDAIAGVQAEFAGVIAAIDTTAEQFKSIRAAAAQVARWAKHERPPASTTTPFFRPMPAPIVTPTGKQKPAVPAGDGTYNSAQMKVLRSLAMWRTLGIHMPSREMVAAAAGYKPSTGNYGNIIGSLVTLGAVGKPDVGCLSIEVDGLAMTREEGRDMLIATLNGPQRRIVGALVDAGAKTREQLAADTGYQPNTGNYGNLLGSLNTIGVTYKPGTGQISLSDWAQELLTGCEARLAA